jgi:diguanylate cyclase (GGDEF)-like protein
VIEERLSSVQRENEYLKAFNQQLVAALADASRNGAEANHLANHDALTGLPNRLMLLRRLQDSIADAFRRQTQLSLMFIDLDGFKIINDRFGHEMGDKLLTVVASRISSCVRADDLACRYGGDEFVVMLSNVGNASIAVAIAEEIRARIEGRYSIDGHEVHVSASVGLANFPADGAYPAALLSSADASMYRGKASRSREGRGAVEPALAAQGA